TSGRPNAVGRPTRRHPATLGTAASSWPAVWPATNRKRSSARSPHTTYLADPTVRAVHSASTKPVTSAAFRRSRPSSPSAERVARRHRLGRQPQRVTLRASRLEKLVDPRRCQLASTQLPAREPPARMRHELELIAGRMRPVPLSRQLLSEPARVWLQRSGHPNP